MAHQPDVQKHQQTQEQHQRFQELQNVVYIHPDQQSYRNQNYQFPFEEQNNLVGNQLFQPQNANFGQFENHCPFVSSGHFSPSNSSATIIPQSFERNKNKNASSLFKNSQPASENNSINSHQRNDGAFQIAPTNYHNLNYEQSSQFFLPNIGNQYQLNDILVPTYQSSSSSESSDESSISNISQSHYVSESSRVLNNQFEFPTPLPTNQVSQVNRSFQQFQQKDFLDNYGNILQQDSQIPRCDSSKSETAESTCSSLSSGSTESQSENENIIQVPVLVNPVLNNNGNCNILQSYQTNTQGNIPVYSNQMHHNQASDLNNQRNYPNHSDQNLLNSNNDFVSMVNTDNPTNSEISNILPANNQMNNLVVMLPNHSNKLKTIQNCMVANQSILQNPSSTEILNTSKFVIQNQKANQQKIYGLINVSNQTSQGKIKSHVQLNQDMKFNNKNIQESCSNNDHLNMKISGKCASFEENRSNNVINNNNNNNNNNNVLRNIAKSNKNYVTNSSYCSNSAKLLLVEKPLSESNAFDNSASQIQNTSDSSVINSSFNQNKHSTMPIENESSAIFSNETSDKNSSQCISDVNSSLVDSTDVFSIKNNEKDVFKNICFDESSSSTTASCFSANSLINALPVPSGWKRLLVDGSIVYLSPTNIALSSLEQVKMYLQTVGTCKCGLECPVYCDSVFNFNPKIISRPWDLSDSELTRLCNHKRKAPTSGSSIVGAEKVFKLNRKEIIPTKRKKKKHGGSGSGVSVSQLLAQRDRALAAAAARWSMNTQSGAITCQNVVGNQYQNIQVVRDQVQDCPQVSFENNSQTADVFKAETPLAQLTDVKQTQLPCINVINNFGREGSVLNLNGMSQLLPENHSADHELLRPTVNAVISQGQEMGPGIIGHAVNYGQSGQEFMTNEMIGPRPEGVVLTPQGMVLPPNMIMQRPRSIPPWHQTKVDLDRKQVPETSVVYDRVSCIQQHMPPPTLVFEDINSRKKHKNSPKMKKASQEPIQNQPSFMDNPSAYLAQQTALLHNTISLPNFSVTRENRPITVLPQNVPHLPAVTEGETLGAVINNSNSGLSSNVLLSSSPKSTACSVRPVLGQKADQSNFIHPQICHKNVLEKATADPGETTNLFKTFSFNNHMCSDINCSDCKKSDSLEMQGMSENSGENPAKEKCKIVQESLENSNSNAYDKLINSKADWRGFVSNQSSTSKYEDLNNVLEESPVTSSTEKSPAVYNQKIISDSRPIQGGTVSTSNGSPQPQASPKCSEFSFHNPTSSSKASYNSSNSGVCSSAARDTDNILSRFKSDNSLSKNVDVSQSLTSFGNCQQEPESPDTHQGYKSLSSNFVDLKSSDRKFQQNIDSLEEPTKNSSVSSTFDVQKETRKEKSNDIKGSRVVRTMASGHTVSSNTLTSVQAGKTQTATVTVSSSSPISPTTISLVNFTNQASLNLPVSHKSNAKTPLEMVQSVVSSIQTSPAVVKSEMQPSILAVNKTVLPTSNVLNNILTTTASITTSMLANNSNSASFLKTSPGGLQAGHILVSNNGQYIVASSGSVIPQTNISGLKLNQTNSMPSMSASPVVTSVTGSITQVLPAVGVAQQVLGQPTVLVNALPAPFVIQPGVMAVDTGLGRLAVATGNVLQSSLLENNSLRSSIRGLSSPEKIKNKKGSKKRKPQVAPLVQVASPNNVILNQPFNQQNFALSPGGNVQPLQALTLLQGKHGGTAQIMMNNQNNFNQFGGQPQQINLLQPVNLTSVPNFPAFQQFIVPGLGNMVMSTDGTTTILPDTNIGVQLQLQNVNGQNVLTPVQNTGFINGQGILTTPAGMLIRAPNNPQKIVQNNPSSQFLSPNNSQFLVNQFQGQLSPLIAANLSPNQQIFTSSPPRQSPQEYIQIIPTSSSQNTTVVQQNTTIVQQQTTMVSNSQNILNNTGKSGFILNNSNEKPMELQFLNGSQQQAHPPQSQPQPQPQPQPQSLSNQQPRCSTHEKVEIGTQHSVSTQTVINKEANNVGIATNNSFCQTLSSNWSGSPPDTTTHSPIESESNQERALTPLVEGKSEDCLPQAMVQYVSSSINESENEGEGYLLPGIPKLLTSCDVLPKSNEKPKNIVESSTVLQESGIQIQIGGSCVPSRRFKSTADERIVSSHSDITGQDKHMEFQSNITSYEEDKARFVDAHLSETRSDKDSEGEKCIDAKEKLSEGDLVWGSVRGSLAWPGKLVGPISPGGRAMVRWFGGHASPSRVNVSLLQSLSQGLEAHHNKASNKGRKRRRLNSELEAAIQEAMLELDKMTGQEKKSPTGSGRPRRSNR